MGCFKASLVQHVKSRTMRVCSEVPGLNLDSLYFVRRLLSNSLSVGSFPIRIDCSQLIVQNGAKHRVPRTFSFTFTITHSL